MNAQFFQSWRGALLIAAVVTVGVSGYKAIFGPDTATRIAQARMSRLLPGGQPTQRVRHLVVTQHPPLREPRDLVGHHRRHVVAQGHHGRV